MQSIDKHHPTAHEQSCRLRLALDASPKAFPAKVQDVLQSQFLSKLPSQSVAESNQEYLHKHKGSGPHVQAAVRLGSLLEDHDKAKSVRSIQETLDASDLSIKEAVDGLRLLEEMDGGVEARQGYIHKAHQRWPEATAFR